MPYVDLSRQAIQRFASRADLDAADCPFAQREEDEEDGRDTGGLY